MKNKNLRRFVSILAGIFVSVSVLTVNADDAGVLKIDISFDNDSRALSFSGKVSDLPNEFLIVRVKPYSENEDFSNESLSKGDFIITRTLISDSDGNIDASIVLPEKFLGRRYSYIFSSSKEEQRGVFAALNKSSLASIAQAASAADENEMLLLLKDEVPQTGIDNGDAGKDFAFMAKMLVNTRPAEAYTAESFTKDYMVAEGLVYVRSGSITVAEYFNKYAAYFDSDYLSGYKALNAKAAAYVDEGLKTIIPTERFDGVYRKLVFVASVRAADSYSKVRELVLEYSAANNIEMPVYNSLKNDYYEEKVFKDLYEQASSLTDVEAVFNQIEANAEKYKNKKSSSSSGGSSSGGGGGGGTFSAINKKPAETPDTTDPADKNSGFNDAESHWAKEYIKKAKTAGIINGYGDGSFRPDNYVTRAELVKIVISLTKEAPSYDEVFGDVQKDAWYFPYISTAYNKGYISGTGQGFAPQKEITREDACVIIYNAVKNMLGNASSESTAFADEEQISDYAKTAVAELQKRGIVNGYQSSFAPKASMTRGELAAVLSKVLDAAQK